MDITCKYKISSQINQHVSSIQCRIRFSLEAKLSTDEKKEIITSLCQSQNVPVQYQEIHNAINNIHFPMKSVAQKDMAFITSTNDNSYCIEIMLTFSAFSKFEMFMKENNLTAEKI